MEYISSVRTVEARSYTMLYGSTTVAAWQAILLASLSLIYMYRTTLTRSGFSPRDMMEFLGTYRIEGPRHLPT